MQSPIVSAVYAILLACAALSAASAGTFRVATYNLEGYLDHPGLRRQPKPESARAKIRAVIRSAAPDVLALQEIGSAAALTELARGLKSEGLDFPYAEYISGADTNLHLSILSRFPFALRRPHTNDTFLLSGRRWHVGRGFAEVEVKVNSDYAFTLLTAHLKSRREVPQADQAEIRLAEAKLLRAKIDSLLAADPEANVVVLGDFNDTKDSDSMRLIIGRAKTRLRDTRPAEQDTRVHQPSSGDGERRLITWTHFYEKNDTYSRIDYILLSPGMAREWLPEQTRLATLPDWGVASDHRLVVAGFVAEDH